MTNLPFFDPFKALDEARRERARELPQKLPQPPAEELSHVHQEFNPTSAASATSAGSDARDVARARPRVKEEEEKNSIISNTYAREGARADASASHVTDRAAKVAEAAEVSLSHSNKRNYPKIAVAEVFGEGLRKWRAALNQLDPERDPCPGYRGSEWPQVYARALAFLDTFGAQAEALGWTAPRLFGVHPEAGIGRVDSCGALVLPIGGPVRAITATEIIFGHLTHRAKPGQPEGAPIWEFGR